MKTIIVPTDFSSVAENSIDYAANLAQFFDAKMVLVHACQLVSVSYEVPFSQETISQMQTISQESLIKIRANLHKKFGPDLTIECVSEIGSPFDIITTVTTQKKGDLIVMGVVGEAGLLKERLIGSTALTVARNQHTPTFIIPANCTYSPIEKISFACDLENQEQAELLYKTKLICQVFEAELEIVNVGDLAEMAASEKVARYMMIEPKFAHVRHRTVYIDGLNVVKELEDYFKMNPTDLIILSPQKHNPLYYLFNNSITKSLVFHAKQPILTIH